jgi:hypothetical protein
MRPEEIIVEVYRQKTELLKQGIKPARVILAGSRWDEIRRYKGRMGDLPDGAADYLGQDHLFGLEILIDNDVDCRVE